MADDDSAPEGTTRWAREVFAAELDRLGVVCDRRRVLDARLDELAKRIWVSRAQLIRAYLTADGIRSLARQVATEVTGRNIGLLEAAAAVSEEHPESRRWPETVRNYLIDHVSTGTAAGTYTESFAAPGVSVADVGLFRFRYRDPADLAGQLGYGADGLVPVVSIQHRDLLARPGPLQADSRWGRPHFEWAYTIVHDAYFRHTANRCPRLL